MHTCHLDICQTAVPPSRLFCRPHWFMVPKPLRDNVWATYRPGQEIDKQPSREYMDAQQAARIAVLERIRNKGCADPGYGGCIGERCDSCKARSALERLSRSGGRSDEPS